MRVGLEDHLLPGSPSSDEAAPPREREALIWRRRQTVITLMQESRETAPVASDSEPIAVGLNKTHSLKTEMFSGSANHSHCVWPVCEVWRISLISISTPLRGRSVWAPLTLLFSSLRGSVITFSAWSHTSTSPRNFSGRVDRLSLKVKPNTS